MKLSYRVVLVRPRDPNNIGAVARAMKNFGLTDLAVVAPYAPHWHEAVSAVNAADVLTSARVCNSLVEAIANCTLVVGTTDRTRVETKRALYTPRDLHEELKETNQRLALVFGSEKHGLTNDDLTHCHRVMSIPTQPDCPSMNLGQAVAVCCYELIREASPPNRELLQPPFVTASETEISLQLLLDVLQLSGFLLPGNKTVREQKLRQSLLRFQLTKQEASFFCGALRQIKSQLTTYHSEKETHPRNHTKEHEE